jgi:hypothetical protein
MTSFTMGKFATLKGWLRRESPNTDPSDALTKMTRALTSWSKTTAVFCSVASKPLKTCPVESTGRRTL